VRRSHAELERDFADLNAYVDHLVLQEQDEVAREMEACETRRLHDWGYRRRFDRAHPGRERDGCDCAGHRAWHAWRRTH
jgi:hypothetical protein